MGKEKTHEKPGRPFGTLKYDNEEDLQAGVDAYFAKCEANNKPKKMIGLALALNVDLKTLSNYSKMDNYFPIINRARHECLDWNFDALYDKNSFQGAKLVITNDAERMIGVRYSDKQEVSMDIAPVSFVNNLED